MQIYLLAISTEPRELIRTYSSAYLITAPTG